MHRQALPTESDTFKVKKQTNKIKQNRTVWSTKQTDSSSQLSDNNKASKSLFEARAEVFDSLLENLSGSEGDKTEYPQY